MNLFARCYCRTYQKVFLLARRFLDFSEPDLLEREGALKEDLPATLKMTGLDHFFLVISKFLFDKGVHLEMEKALKERGIVLTIYSDVDAEPTFDLIEKGVSLYKESNSQGLIAIGGGSAMDTMKAIGARIANPKKSLHKLGGVLKVTHMPPLMVAIPTTAGTGSEVTVAAVVVDKANHDKFSINDPKLIPDIAVLDGSLLASLPKSLIAQTGMDALTHAIESYIGHSGTKKTKKDALTAMKLIHEHLPSFYKDAKNVEARDAMLKASYLAGLSFTKAYVGYVHALAHAMGGFYGTSHGWTNAVLLPYVLKAFGKSAYKKLAEISDHLALTGKEANPQTKAAAVIAWIEELNETFGIEKNFAGILKKEDIPALARHAEKEGNPLYPVPKEMNAKELEKILEETMG